MPCDVHRASVVILIRIAQFACCSGLPECSGIVQIHLQGFFSMKRPVFEVVRIKTT